LENLQFLQIDLARWWHFEISDLFGGRRSELLGDLTLKFLIYSVAVDWTCPVVVHWSSGFVQWQQIGLAQLWCIGFLDLFSGSRSHLPDGGALEFQICSMEADQIFPVVAYWSSGFVRW